MKRTPVASVKLSPDTVREIEAAAFGLCEQALSEPFPGLYLLDVAFEKEAGAWFLRVTLEKAALAKTDVSEAVAPSVGPEKGVSLNDCEAVSRLLDPLLDGDAPLLKLLGETSYSLEVSSPGLFRPLRRARELAFYQGRPVRLEARPDKRKKTPLQALPKPEEGILLAFDETRQTVTLKKPDKDSTVEVLLDESRVLCLNPTVQFPEDDSTTE